MDRQASAASAQAGRHALAEPNRRLWITVVVAVVALVAAVIVGAVLEAGDDQLSIPEAILLGLVEGLTEYLPVSSTAHLAVVQDLLGLTSTEESQAAADAYAIVIQVGAIAAVLGLYRTRVKSLISGVVGTDPDGRRLAMAVVAAFVPAAVAGLTLGDVIKDELFSTWPIVAAWIVGGVALLSGRLTLPRGTASLETLTVRGAAIIGFAQILALWPGTSRSLVTIIAALAIGLSLAAAVEFSFLLGLVTLGAATAYELLRDGQLIWDTFGFTNSLIGVIAAAVTAWVAVTWMVSYLQRRPLSIFGWYRIGIAGAVTVLALSTDLL